MSRSGRLLWLALSPHSSVSASESSAMPHRRLSPPLLPVPQHSRRCGSARLAGASSQELQSRRL